MYLQMVPSYNFLASASRDKSAGGSLCIASLLRDFRFAVIHFLHIAFLASPVAKKALGD